MRRFEASRTAAWVAVARSLGTLLPKELELAVDPFGVRFAIGMLGPLADAMLRHPALGQRVVASVPALRSFVLWMQLRTRALDDVLREFVASGGRQLVLLGAGYDCRAHRFEGELRDVAVFEVDHPATQASKRERVADASADVRYLAWDFENEPLAALPARLEALGLDPRARTLVVWEGVTMYLGEPAIRSTLELMRSLGAAGSRLAFTYVDRVSIERPRGRTRWTQRLVASVGEPWRFGFDPTTLEAFLAPHGLRLVSDESDADLARRFLPPGERLPFGAAMRHVAVAETLG